MLFAQSEVNLKPHNLTQLFYIIDLVAIIVLIALAILAIVDIMIINFCCMMLPEII